MTGVQTCALPIWGHLTRPPVTPVTLPGVENAFAVATPLLASDGALITAISATVDSSEADRLDDIGEQPKTAVAAVGS